MRTVLAYPGNMAHAQNTALALYETERLDCFVTSFSWRRDSAAARLLSGLPGSRFSRLARELERRAIHLVPASSIHTSPYWEILRTFCSKAIKNEVVTDWAWDQMAHRFDAMVARRYVPHTQVVQAFEYTALQSFRRARELGVARILHLPSLDSRRFEAVKRRERSMWPELAGPNDAYFDARFERRQARRDEEIALADVIIANSSLTARSHIAAGADPDKVFPVLLGGPPPASLSALRPGGVEAPLRVVWAGPFSLRKGAHYMLEAWRKLQAGSAAQLDIYGQQVLPERLRALDQPGLSFHGSVPQRALFEAFLQADVLVFPTLSDGFGMVVAEAFAHGLPVITTHEAGAADLVAPDNGLLVPAGDPDALADALRWCLDNRRALQEMRQPALETAQRRQWCDFRRDLILAHFEGLTRRGYQPSASLRAAAP